jgi:hypothetical protein
MLAHEKHATNEKNATLNATFQFFIKKALKNGKKKEKRRNAQSRLEEVPPPAQLTGGRHLLCPLESGGAPTLCP